MYNARGVAEYKTIASAPILSIILYKLSSRNPHATHAAGKVSGTEIGDTRSLLKPFMFRAFKGWKENKITRIVDYITPEQRESVIVHNENKPQPQPEVKPVNSDMPQLEYGDGYITHLTLKPYAKTLQKELNKLGYNLDVDGKYGEKTAAAVKAYQRKNGLEVDGIAGKYTWGALLGAN
jgi:murein L,D-transpeptidase YcbB/YkuD